MRSADLVETCARVNFPKTMAYIITETCVDLKDKSCVDVCPVDCIIDGGAEDRMLYINPDECIDCGACVDPVSYTHLTLPTKA